MSAAVEMQGTDQGLAGPSAPETTAPVAASVSERTVAAIERAWQSIRAVHDDVTDVIITVGSGTLHKKEGVRLGHFASGRWVRPDAAEDDPGMHELFVGGEGFVRGAEDVFATLLHEAVHCAAHVRGIQDTSRQGRYHNKKFQAIAEEFGLLVEHDSSIGWSLTRLAPSTATTYAEAIAALDAALSVYRHQEIHATGKKKGETNYAKAICSCGRTLRVAKSTLAQGPIVCGLCGDPFVVEGDEADDANEGEGIDETSEDEDE